jgi:hypothetical protein
MELVSLMTMESPTMARFRGNANRGTVPRRIPATPVIRRHEPTGGHLADDAVDRIGDIEVASAVDRHAGGRIEARHRARSVHPSRAAEIAGNKLEAEAG